MFNVFPQKLNNTLSGVFGNQSDRFNIIVKNAYRRYTTVFTTSTVNAYNIQKALEAKGFDTVSVVRGDDSLTTWGLNISLFADSSNNVYQIQTKIIAALSEFFTSFDIQVTNARTNAQTVWYNANTPTAYDNAVTTVRDTGDYVATHTTNAINTAIRTTQATANGIKTFTVNGITYIYDTANNTLKTVSGGVVNATQTITPYVYETGKNIKNNLPNALPEWFQGLPDFVKDMVKGVSDSLKLSIPLALMVLVLFGVIILKKR